MDYDHAIKRSKYYDLQSALVWLMMTPLNQLCLLLLLCCPQRVETASRGYAQVQTVPITSSILVFLSYQYIILRPKREVRNNAEKTVICYSRSQNEPPPHLCYHIHVSEAMPSSVWVSFAIFVAPIYYYSVSYSSNIHT